VKLEMLKNMKHKMPSGPKEKDSMLDLEAVDAELADGAMPEAEGPLSKVPDEDLLAEIRKRGLSPEGEMEDEEDSIELELEPAEEEA
jgi:hypothetical protein